MLFDTKEEPEADLSVLQIQYAEVKDKLTKLVDDKVEISTMTDLQKELEKKSKIYEAYDKFLINKYGAEYEKYYGTHEREFIDFYYGEKYKLALERMQLYKGAHDEDCVHLYKVAHDEDCTIDLSCCCKKYCCICKDIITKAHGYYTIVDNDTCNEKCRDMLIKKFEEHGIFISDFCIPW